MRNGILSLLFALLAIVTMTFSGCGDDASCGQAEQSACSTQQNTCVGACNPLGGDYQGCVDKCNTDLCTCLTNAGCTCDKK